MDRLMDLAKCYSTWVVAALLGAAAYWLQMEPAEQQTLLAAYPWLAFLHLENHVGSIAVDLPLVGRRIEQGAVRDMHRIHDLAAQMMRERLAQVV